MQVTCPTGPLCLLPEAVHQQLEHVLVWEPEVGHLEGSLVALDVGKVGRGACPHAGVDHRGTIRIMDGHG